MNDINLKCFGYPDEFIKHGDVADIEKKYGLDIDNILNKILKNIRGGN